MKKDRSDKFVWNAEDIGLAPESPAKRLESAVDRALQGGAKSPTDQTKTYTIRAPQEVLTRFERFLAHVQRCANIGHSTTVGMEIDGDGPDYFYVEDPKLPKGKDVSDSEKRVEVPAADYDAAAAAPKQAKEAVLYVLKPDTQYQCKDCPLYLTGDRCVIHGIDDVIKGIGSCGFWVKGNPNLNNHTPPLGLVTKLESGYMENEPGFSCKRCSVFGGAEIKKCARVDENSQGDTPGEINPDACCNAWTPEKANA